MRVVDAATIAILNVLATLDTVVGEHIGLSAALSPLTRVHAEHLGLLGPGSSVPGLNTAVPVASAREALAQVRRDELALQHELAGLALDAASGQLAQALASMSASIAQHLVVLPELGKGPA